MVIIIEPELLMMSINSYIFSKIGTKNLQQPRTTYLSVQKDGLTATEKQLDKKFLRLHLVRNQVSMTQNAAPKRCRGAKSRHFYYIYIYISVWTTYKMYYVYVFYVKFLQIIGISFNHIGG
jgi:hypothetical protein